MEDFPAAVPSDNPREMAQGEVYLLRSPSRVLSELDVYEKRDPAHPDRGLYRRERTTVVMQDGQPAQAWIYFLNRPTAGMRLIEAGDFADVRPSPRPAATRRS